MATNGGGGSSRRKSPVKSIGPTSTILIGNTILYPRLFQATGEVVPSQDSGGWVNTCVLVVKSVFEINIKANAQTRKMITNLVLEMFIYFLNFFMY